MTSDVLARSAQRAPVALACCTVALQVGYPLTDGALRDRLSVLIVVTLAAACFAHAAVRGGRAVTALAGAAAIGFTSEVLGVRNGIPFGTYRYGDSLGPSALGVPLVVGLAWTMLAWPAALAARRLVDGYLPRVVVGTWALAACDLFLDPQQVAAGHWRWTGPGPHLPGVASVPLSNYAGWLVVSLAISAVLQRAVTVDADDRVAHALYLWLYVGWVVAFVAFLDLRAAAVWGALGMGAVALPLLRRIAR